MKALAQNTLIQNRYLIVHLIGKGGMGEVYLAVDQRLGSAVALKRTYFAGDEMLGNAFEREARILARMRHPVLPKVSDHFGENEEQYLVMEHIAGDDLAKRLEAAQKPFPVSWVLFWADQLLDALSYLHSHEPPIIHRDIKPQNLKLTDENHIILLDFGLSKSSTGQTHISNSGSTGSVVGYTPHYAPMEQIRGIGTNPRSDIYSLSATLYQLMTNVIPADALSRADALLNGMADPIRPPHELNPEIPATVSEVILKGMEVSQEKRFSNAREMQKALRRAFTQMQEAMSAQTVAFNMGDVLPSEQPIVAAMQDGPSGGLDSVPPQLPVPAPGANGDIDLDATLAFDPQENYEQAQQTGVRTELFTPQVETNGAVGGAALAEFNEDAGNVHDSFVTVLASGARKAEAVELPNGPTATALAGPAPRKSGRALAFVGGTVAVLVLALGAAGAGWYYYNNYYALTPVVEPSPSPEPTLQEVIEPPASTQVEIDTNTSTETNASTATEPGTGTNSAVAGDQTNTSEPRTRTEADGPPSRQTVNPRATTNRPQVTTKSTPKPKTTRGRTDILQ